MSPTAVCVFIYKSMKFNEVFLILFCFAVGGGDKVSYIAGVVFIFCLLPPSGIIGVVPLCPTIGFLFFNELYHHNPITT